ncbi:MAG: allantoinase PuuE [Methylobacteriaceae bacterium]|nr:allantoinase PuuE [Methylobacteriaceae bacterium]
MRDDPPRDLVGYGSRRPSADWPGGARVAVSFVLNYEEGGERNVADGDEHAEHYLVPEIVGLLPLAGRNRNVEDLFEYGSRAGFWRVLRLFNERRLPFTAWAVGLALQRNPEAGQAMAEGGHEVASHSWRWIDYKGMPEAEERQHIRNTVETIRAITGAPPLGWYTGRYSQNTRRLVMEETECIYDSDAYNDDLPYWTEVAGKPRLIVPYALDTNDFKFALTPGWMSGEDFFVYLKAAFDQLYREGEREPKMLSIGLHCRLVGRPGRADALARFLDHVQRHDKAWVCRRVEIARHWIARHPYVPDQAAAGRAR